MTLVVWFCVAALDTQCDAAAVAQGFVHEQQCRAYAPLMLAGWEVLHPALRLEHWLCTESANYILNGGKA